MTIRTLFFISLSVLAPLGVLVLIILAVQIRNQSVVDNLANAQQQLADRGREIAQLDVVGGATPQATLEQFDAAMMARDSARAIALCVPAVRDHIAGLVGALSDDDRAAMHAALMQLIAKMPQDVTSTALTLVDPAYVDLIRYPSGVWKIASF